MPSTSNKDRIYIALYARGAQDPDSYHWAIIVGPKNEVAGDQGVRYHVRNRLDPDRPGQLVWQYEALDVPLIQTSSLLARVLIGKVTNGPRLTATLEEVRLIQGDPGWDCQSWVRDAIAALEKKGGCLGTSVTDWQKVVDTAKSYVSKKRQQRRYDGSGSWKPGTVPTYDLLENKETIP